VLRCLLYSIQVLVTVTLNGKAVWHCIDAMGLVEVMVSCLDAHVQQLRSALPQSPSDSVADDIAICLLVLAAYGRACRRCMG